MKKKLARDQAAWHNQSMANSLIAPTIAESKASAMPLARKLVLASCKLQALDENTKDTLTYTGLCCLFPNTALVGELIYN